MYSHTLLSVIASVLAGVSVASAAMLTPPVPPPAIEKQVPAGTTGVAFFNLQRMFELHGDLLKKSSWYKSVLPMVQQGLPDPATDLHKVAMTITLKAGDKPFWGTVVQGNVNLPSLQKFAAAQHVTVTAGSYQGIPTYTGPFRRQSFQVGFVDGTTTFMSVDAAGNHPATAAIVATLTGQAPSYGSATGTILPADFLVQGAFTLTPDLQESISHIFFEGAKKVQSIAVQIRAADANHDLEFAINVACDDAATVAQVQQLIANYTPYLTGPRGPFSTLTTAANGNVAAVKATMTKQALERFLTGH